MLETGAWTEQALFPVTPSNLAALEGGLTAALAKAPSAGVKSDPPMFCSEPLFASFAGKITLFSASVSLPWIQELPIPRSLKAFRAWAQPAAPPLASQTGIVSPLFLSPSTNPLPSLTLLLCPIPCQHTTGQPLQMFFKV